MTYDEWFASFTEAIDCVRLFQGKIDLVRGAADDAVKLRFYSAARAHLARGRANYDRASADPQAAEHETHLRDVAQRQHDVLSRFPGAPPAPPEVLSLAKLVELVEEYEALVAVVDAALARGEAIGQKLAKDLMALKSGGGAPN